MCGINGFTYSDKNIAEEMNRLLYHRGPDKGGVFSDDSVTLGHRRLKIIDLSEKADQPLSDTQKKVWVTFNGEIYNFESIKRELEDLGYDFASKTDTEIIANAYREWGYDCVDRFNGMWAFALYDTGKKILFLSRDRFGKKPLYYTLKNSNLIFSSEIKPLFLHGSEKKLNFKAVSSFLSYRYVLGEETMFEGIMKLLPAHSLVFDIEKGKIEKIWEYWDMDKKDINIPEDTAKDKVGMLIKQSITYRQISDVPIGSINSGGLDSSLVTAIMAAIKKDPVRSFTVKFPEGGYDETPFARLLANHCKTLHKEIIVDTGNYLEAMRDYMKAKDTPSGVPNEIALYLLFKEIKKSVTVILSGEGADELFAGYSRIFRSPFDYERIKTIEKENPDDYESEYGSLFKKYNGRFFKDELEHFLFLYNYFPDNEKNTFLRPEAQKDFRPVFEKYYNRINGSYYKKISYLFLKLHLPGLLARLDCSSMRSAVEARAPFLDFNLINTVFNLPFSLKNPWKSESDRKEAGSKSSDEIAENLDITKYILKKVAEDYIPQEIIDRKKQGFPLPLQKWFKKDFLKEARELLLSDDSKITMVAEIEKLSEWIEKGLNGDDNGFGQKLWMLVSLELWLREWF